MKKVMIICPPCGERVNFGSDRCFGLSDIFPGKIVERNEEIRIAGALEKDGYEVFFRDYESEKLNYLSLLDDVLSFKPDAVYMKTCINGLFSDLKILRTVSSSLSDSLIILGSKLFFGASEKFFEETNLTCANFLVAADAEIGVPRILNSVFKNTEPAENIPFICIREGQNFKRTSFSEPAANINDLVIPQRNYLKSELYLMPDLRHLAAVIDTVRGTEDDDILSLPAPKGISFRNTSGIMDEMLDCFNNHGIRDFCFPDYKFTRNTQKVLELCNMINSSVMADEINLLFCCDVKSFCEEVAEKLKEAGCNTVIFPFISGSDKILNKINMFHASDDNAAASVTAGKAGLKVCGIYVCGFPDDDLETLSETSEQILKLNSEKLILSILLPYPGSINEKNALKENIIKEPLMSENGIKIPHTETKFLSSKQLIKFRSKILLAATLNPRFVVKKFKEIINAPQTVVNCIKKIFYKYIG